MVPSGDKFPLANSATPYSIPFESSFWSRFAGCRHSVKSGSSLFLTHVKPPFQEASLSNELRADLTPFLVKDTVRGMSSLQLTNRSRTTGYLTVLLRLVIGYIQYPITYNLFRIDRVSPID